MLRHEGDAEVAQYGCAAIAYLAGPQENVAELLSSGAGEAVIACMRRRPDVSAIAGAACHALRRLAREGNDGGNARLRRAGAVEALTDALRRHPANALVAEHGAIGRSILAP